MAASGIHAVVEPAFRLGQPRTNAGSFADYFDSLIGWIPVNSAAGRGRSDPLPTPATAAARAAGLDADEVHRAFWRNPAEFYGSSGRLDLPAGAGPVL